jgi:lipoate---protein ligase
MKLIFNSYPSAEENLAFEEWYFKNFEEETIRIWRNPSSVIIGKHQNAYAESDLLYCNESAIPIIRRISGGGTVFHDSGNLNFSFFRFVDIENPISYKRNLEIIKACLNALGYTVNISPRNDLFYENYKISGNAQHLSKGRVLHHGTILYDSDKEKLNKAIKRSSGRYEDKSVKSVRSQVCNLRDKLDIGNTDVFLFELLNWLNSRFSFLEVGTIDLSREIDEKYNKESWNYHYGPAYTFYSEDAEWPIELSVERGGKILNASSENTRLNQIITPLIDQTHSPKVIRKLLNESSLVSPELDEMVKRCF